ncbi:MAG: hypothetical protein KID00_10050 [Clostridium argentinense]|uniref:Uncharacterized protein n=1 Tax=Clostridium faecium TaxID=2762223 RepID=A0ABR8YXK0_9CLOT|nr:hypothetical protein [Clostridium faecium]MBS5824184.1 hypothetical protein [Clostridium argentinense]
MDYAVREGLIKIGVKNFYWEYKISDIEIEWIDDKTIKMNNHTIYLPNESYDWRHQNIKLYIINLIFQ